MVIHVLMVIERYLPIWGGAENQLAQLAPVLMRKGCRVTIVTRRWKSGYTRQERMGGITIIRLGIPGTHRWATLVFVLSLACFVVRRRSNTDILHSHGAVKLGAFCALLARTCKLINVAKIATAGKIEELVKTNTGKIVLGLFKKSDCIIVMTDEIESELLGVGLEGDRLVRITNGVDLERFSSENKGHSLKSQLKISDTDKVVLFAGRLVYRKGLDLLLQAWPAVVEACPEAELLILGSGADQSDSMEHEAKQYVDRNNLPQVRFVGEYDKPEHYLEITDCFVFPSRLEGFPNALLEAMAAAVPIVASDIGGVAPLIKHRESGLLFQVEDHNDLAANIVALLEDCTLASRLGEQARRCVERTYSFETIARSYMDLYETLLDCHPAGRAM